MSTDKYYTSAPNCWIWFGRPLMMMLSFLGVLFLTVYLTASLASDEWYVRLGFVGCS